MSRSKVVVDARKFVDELGKVPTSIHNDAVVVRLDHVLALLTPPIADITVTAADAEKARLEGIILNPAEEASIATVVRINYDVDDQQMVGILTMLNTKVVKEFNVQRQQMVARRTGK